MDYEVGLIFIDDEDYPNKAKWCNENGCYIEEIEPKEDGTRQFQIKKPKEKTDEEKLQEHIANITNAVQQKLDETAHSKGYDNGAMCATYVFDDDETFKSEGIAYVKWRGKVWRYCYDLLAKYQAGEIELPSVDYVLENMPEIEW